MIKASEKPFSVIPPLGMLFPCALLAGALSCAALWCFLTTPEMAMGDFVPATVIFGVGAALLCGPSRLILTVLFLYALLGHQFRSVVIIPAFGVEWHPRELLLLLLLAHGAISLWQQRFWLQWSPLHVCMLLYTAFFVYAGWRGLWLGNPPRAIIAELRAPLFLAAFWVFAGCIRRPRDFNYYGYLALCVTTVLAALTVATAVYGTLAGPGPNTQNALGEFVPRAVAGVVVQSVRPSGHAWFEVGLIMCVGLFFCPSEPWSRRVVYVALGALFTGAIAVGMMRTAVVSVAVGLCVLAWLALPRAGKGFALGLAALTAFAGIWVLVKDGLPGAIPEASLNARLAESRGAVDAMQASLFFGAGLGASFEGLGLAQETSGASAIPVAIDSLHNAWLYLAWKGGLVGLGVVVLGIAGLLLYSSVVTARLPCAGQRCIARGLQAALVGQLVASCAMPRLTYASGALFLALWTMAFVLLDQQSHESRAVAVVTREGDVDLPEAEVEETAEERPAPNVSSSLEQL